jgi:hypothetical protein
MLPADEQMRREVKIYRPYPKLLDAVQKNFNDLTLILDRQPNGNWKTTPPVSSGFKITAFRHDSSSILTGHYRFARYSCRWPKFAS